VHANASARVSTSAPQSTRALTQEREPDLLEICSGDLEFRRSFGSARMARREETLSFSPARHAENKSVPPVLDDGLIIKRSGTREHLGT